MIPLAPPPGRLLVLCFYILVFNHPFLIITIFMFCCVNSRFILDLNRAHMTSSCYSLLSRALSRPHYMGFFPSHTQLVEIKMSIDSWMEISNIPSFFNSMLLSVVKLRYRANFLNDKLNMWQMKNRPRNDFCGSWIHAPLQERGASSNTLLK